MGSAGGRFSLSIYVPILGGLTLGNLNLHGQRQQWPLRPTRAYLKDIVISSTRTRFKSQVPVSIIDKTNKLSQPLAWMPLSRYQNKSTEEKEMLLVLRLTTTKNHLFLR